MRLLIMTIIATILKVLFYPVLMVIVMRLVLRFCMGKGIHSLAMRVIGKLVGVVTFVLYVGLFGLLGWVEIRSLIRGHSFMPLLGGDLLGFLPMLWIAIIMIVKRDELPLHQVVGKPSTIDEEVDAPADDVEAMIPRDKSFAGALIACAIVAMILIAYAIAG